MTPAPAPTAFLEGSQGQKLIGVMVIALIICVLGSVCCFPSLCEAVSQKLGCTSAVRHDKPCSRCFSSLMYLPFVL